MNLYEMMKNCEQTKGQSVWDHGWWVRQYFDDLECKWLKIPTEQEWKLPKYWDSYEEDIFGNSNTEEVMWAYTLLHDCGKPFCKEIIDGKVHFPNHAEVSSKIYLEHGKEYFEDWLSEDQHIKVSELIRDDMILHTCSSEELSEKIKDSNVEHMCSLVISAWCELNGNAAMFGGFDTVSFKSKFKHLDRRTKQICKYYFGEKNESV